MRSDAYDPGSEETQRSSGEASVRSKTDWRCRLQAPPYHALLPESKPLLEAMLAMPGTRVGHVVRGLNSDIAEGAGSLFRVDS